MLSDWENKFRKHWPHHYRDVLDKLESPLGMVVVNDTVNSKYECDRPIVRLEKSFKQPIKYTILVQDPSSGNKLDEIIFEEEKLNDSIEKFVEIIGGWENQQAPIT